MLLSILETTIDEFGREKLIKLELSDGMVGYVAPVYYKKESEACAAYWSDGDGGVSLLGNTTNL